MKKTKFMRAALLLLVLTLITSCFVGGTFAKYTTSANGSDTARVAKWGFKPTTITMTDLFKTAYDETVKAGDNPQSDVIAPGTKGEAKFGFTYGGADGITAPEVAYNFTVKADMEGSYTSLDDNPNFKWTLAKGNETATEYNNVADLLAAIKALSGDASGTKKYDAGQLPEAFGTATANTNCTVGWKWAFETKNGTEVDPNQDTTDTAMGNATDLANVTLKITVTATQID